jgi:primosomal protein N' (replication factor Y)
MTAGPAEGDEQLSLPGLVRAEARKAKRPAEKKAVAQAELDPIARVLVDLPLAHLDRPFDYAVPATMAATAVPGARVKVRFAGQDVDGYVVERAADTDHTGRLQFLRRVVSAEPVLSPEIADVVAEVAARYAGTRSDVLRLAVPPRHATTEKLPSTQAPLIVATPDPASWSPYGGGTDLLAALVAGQSPRAVWTVGPGDDGIALLAEATIATAVSGRGALICLPDVRDVGRLDQLLKARLTPGQHVVLTADAGPAKRYSAFLAISRGAVRIVVGTRAAAFAPVRDLGLVALWDDGDDLFAEPRAPYPHAREVLLIRAQRSSCAALLAAHARSVEAEYLVRSGWASEIALPRTELRARVSASITGDSDFDLERDARARTSRLPREVFDVIRDALAIGPVLVQTPRSGYATRLACETCRAPAACTTCHGPLRISAAHEPPTCTWCGTPETAWSCTECGGHGLRAPVLGDRRTAEELGRAFTSVPVRTSAGDRIVSDVDGRPAIVVATPGAEPPAAGGYAAVILLDTWLLLARSDLRAEEEALRRWMNASALVRPGGRLVAVGDPTRASLQALVRWDPSGFAQREIAERQEAHLPPSSRVASLTGPAEVLETALASLQLPAGAEVLGPVAIDGERGDEQRFVVRVPRPAGAQLSAALVALQALRSARKEAHVRVEVDPIALA